MTLSDQAILALKAATATKGKNKGMLLATCPPSNTMAAAAWQGAMMVCNPSKVGTWSCMAMTREQLAVMDEVKAMFEAS